MMDWLSPNPFTSNPTRALTAREAKGLRQMYLTAGLVRPYWDSVGRTTVQDKFGLGGYDIVEKLTKDGFLEEGYVGGYGTVWYVTPQGKEAFQRYVKKHGMPKRRY